MPDHPGPCLAPPPPITIASTCTPTIGRTYAYSFISSAGAIECSPAGGASTDIETCWTYSGETSEKFEIGTLAKASRTDTYGVSLKKCRTNSYPSCLCWEPQDCTYFTSTSFTWCEERWTWAYFPLGELSGYYGPKVIEEEFDGLFTTAGSIPLLPTMTCPSNGPGC